MINSAWTLKYEMTTTIFLLRKKTEADELASLYFYH